METLSVILKRWLPIAAVVVAVCGLIFFAVQQNLRSNADDPQIQLAEDAARALQSGNTESASLSSAAKVDIAQSLAPFVIFYDDSGKVMASSGLLHGQTPAPPPGVFDYVRSHGQERVTWQPERNVRIASIIVRVNGSSPGYVLAGRSLREVEKRKDMVQLQACAALLVMLAVSFAVVALVEIFPRGSTKSGGAPATSTT